jgi:hypothetical protein
VGTKTCPKCAGVGRLLREGRIIQQAASDLFEYYRCSNCNHAWMIYKRSPSETTGHPATPPKSR